MKKNVMKEKILRGEVVFGMGLDTPDPMMVEYAAMAGLDWVRFDLEQGPWSLEGLEHAVRSAEAAGITPHARLAGIRPDVVTQVLNRGVAALTFPHIQTADDARAAVRAAKFAPEGDRTVTSQKGQGMHARWALGIEAEDAFVFANREILVLCLIEDPIGISNIEEIAAVPGVDVLTLGPGDLSAALGYPGNFAHPEVRRVTTEGVRRATATGKAVGLSVGHKTAEPILEYIEAGVTVLQFLPAPLIIDAVAEAKKQLGF